MAHCTFSPPSAPQDNNRAKYSLCAFQLLLPTNQLSTQFHHQTQTQTQTQKAVTLPAQRPKTPRSPDILHLPLRRPACPPCLPFAFSRPLALTRSSPRPAHDPSRTQKPPPCRSQTPSHAPLDLSAGHLHTLPEPECRADKVRISCLLPRSQVVWATVLLSTASSPRFRDLRALLRTHLRSPFYPSVISERPCSRGRKSGS